MMMILTLFSLSQLSLIQNFTKDLLVKSYFSEYVKNMSTESVWGDDVI